MTVDEKAGALSKAQKIEEDRWKAKWFKVFPGLHFYFDVDAEDRVLKSKLLKLGARVDAFFSQKLTHLIIKGGDSPQKPKPMTAAKRVEAMQGSPKNPFIDHTGPSSLAEKAAQMDIRVWTIRKLEEMMSRLVPSELVANDSLHTLLEDEKVHGTRERDINAPRPGHYYFVPGNKYLLVEDATGKNKAIMVKEYQYSQKSGPEYPVLFETFLRPSSQAQLNVPVEKIRDRAWSLYVEREPFENEEPPAELRRSTSLRSLPDTPRLPTTQPYQHASGNSVTITSTIASTSNAQQSPAFVAGVPQLGTKDRAIMQMSKRVQVLKGNARLAAARLQDTSRQSSVSHRRATSDTAPPPPIKTFMTQEQVVKMLQQARGPHPAEAITADARRRNRLKVEAGLKGKDQDTTAGYCENCRLKYNDLSVHIASKKHRRFATNTVHFADLDGLLEMLRRPPNPVLVSTDFPPCHEHHDKDDWKCQNCRAQWSEGENDTTPREEPFSELTEGTEGFYESDEARDEGSEESGEYDEE
ncbi:hypothetical protein BCR39DRAFT_466540 [Naematelia encephala]|uniref:DBF4-type domain-containing protein n=1 Tax=Naematelia encephala TaxID=71784 RepID=A0A1Y2B7V5_9TREE|nr:hypothetical protein BCR39DRAFT_466540 [Naematelia encephala]